MQMSENLSETNVKQAVPFFRVANIEESVRFYVGGLGCKMTKKWVVEGQLRWCWLELGNAALMLQEYPKEGRDSWAPRGKVGEGVSISFQCADALAFYREITRRSVLASPPFVGNGMWVTSTADPDGYQLEFESPTDAAEETRYAEPE
jgi:lactoylglutathione lyase